MEAKLANFKRAAKSSHLTFTSMSKKTGFKTTLLHQSCSGQDQAVPSSCIFPCFSPACDKQPFITACPPATMFFFFLPPPPTVPEPLARG